MTRRNKRGHPSAVLALYYHDGPPTLIPTTHLSLSSSLLLLYYF